MTARQHIDQIFEAAIRMGWVKGEHVVDIPFLDGEDNHHFAHRHLLPNGDDTDWKRWRYNANLGTVFWWEAPTREERDAVETEIGDRVKNVFVELHSSGSSGPLAGRKPGVQMRRASRLMRAFNLDKMTDSDDPIVRGAGNDLLDVTHYPDADKDYVRSWLARDGD